MGNKKGDNENATFIQSNATQTISEQLDPLKLAVIGVGGVQRKFEGNQTVHDLLGLNL